MGHAEVEEIASRAASKRSMDVAPVVLKLVRLVGGEVRSEAEGSKEGRLRLRIAREGEVWVVAVEERGLASVVAASMVGVGVKSTSALMLVFVLVCGGRGIEDARGGKLCSKREAPRGETSRLLEGGI